MGFTSRKQRMAGGFRGMVILGAGLLISSPAALGATQRLYVDGTHPAASDTNSGSSTRPLKTIQRALKLALPGAIVTVRPGVYEEYLSAVNSGTSAAPITVQGERGANGEWLTIIDPSTSVSRGWVPAPEVGPGVFKKSDIGFTPQVLTIQDRTVAGISPTVMDGKPDDMRQVHQIFGSLGSINDGFDFLRLPADATIDDGIDPAGTNRIGFWDGVKAMWGNKDGVTYLRFWDESSPNGRSIRVARNGNGGSAPVNPAISINQRSHLVFRNFFIRNAHHGVALSGANAHHIQLADNKITGGSVRIGLYKGAHDNLIISNDLSLNYYGISSLHAWTQGSTYYNTVQYKIYRIFKTLYGSNTSNDSSIRFDDSGGGNAVVSNHIHNSLVGVTAAGQPEARIPDLTIRGNVVEHMSSIGISLGVCIDSAQVYDNTIADCNSNIRLHNLNLPGGTERHIYIYRNRFELPSRIGHHLYLHFLAQPQPDQVEIWFYHNSLYGGHAGLQFNAFAEAQGGLPRGYFLNNIFSTFKPVYTSSSVLKTPSLLGVIDYNLLASRYTNPELFTVGPHNALMKGYLWTSGTPDDWNLPPGSLPINTALDIHEPFLLDRILFEALPDLYPAGVPDGIPDMGAVESN